MGTVVRRLIVIDKQPNQATFPIINLLNTGVSLPNYALRELTHRKRFVILKDDRIFLSQTGPQIAEFPDYYSKIDMITNYDGNAGTIADIPSNALFVVFVSSEATNVPTIQHATRVRYIDN